MYYTNKQNLRVQKNWMPALTLKKYYFSRSLNVCACIFSRTSSVDYLATHPGSISGPCHVYGGLFDSVVHLIVNFVFFLCGQVGLSSFGR